MGGGRGAPQGQARKRKSHVGQEGGGKGHIWGRFLKREKPTGRENQRLLRKKPTDFKGSQKRSHRGIHNRDSREGRAASGGEKKKLHASRKRSPWERSVKPSEQLRHRLSTLGRGKKGGTGTTRKNHLRTPLKRREKVRKLRTRIGKWPSKRR